MSLSFTEARLRLQRMLSMTNPPEAGKADFYANGRIGHPAIYTTDGMSIALPPNAVVLYDLTTPNDNGGFHFDLDTKPALDCQHIEIIYALRGTVAAVTDNVYTYYNNLIVAASYRYSYHSWSEAAATSPSGGNALPFTMIMPGNTATPSTEYAKGRMRVPRFQDPNVQHRLINRGGWSSASTNCAGLKANNRWSFEPVVSIQIRTDNWGTDDFNSNSHIVVLGHKVI